MAGSGNGNWRWNERFGVNGGLRWAQNNQTFRQIAAGAIVPAANDPGESSESVWTYSISPQYHFTDDTMVYARVATGYRPGGPNVILPGLPPTFDPDTDKNYELGLKTRLFNPALLSDWGVLRMVRDDVQIPIVVGRTSGPGERATAPRNGQ